MTNAGIGGFAGSGLVEPPSLQLHQLDLFAHRRQSQRANQPNWLAMDKALDILAANQRDVFAELLPVQLDESMAMSIFLGEHFVEDGGGGRVIRLEALGKIAVNAGVFLFE